jgi:hypothetical protein
MVAAEAYGVGQGPEDPISFLVEGGPQSLALTVGPPGELA